MAKYLKFLISLTCLHGCALLAQNTAAVTVQQMSILAEQQMNEQNYDAAIESYQQMMSLPAVESAPQSTYLEIAKSYYLKGDQQAATSSLEKARVALKLETGIFRCKESVDSPDYFIVNAKGEAHESPAADEVAAVLCNYFTLENYFYPHSFDEFLRKSERVKAFMELEALISED